jgi:hypothetical protein
MRKEPSDGLEPLALCHGGEVVGHGVGPAVAAQHRPEQKPTLLFRVADPDPYPDPHSICGSGSRRAKITQ